MHVQMNVQDKNAWFAHIARCLAPGARLAIWEVCRPPRPSCLCPGRCRGHSTEPTASSSPPRSLRASIEQAGFAATEWTNETAWVEAWITRTFANGLPAGPALPMLLDDGYTRVLNAIAALSNGSLEIWRGVFTGKAD